MPTIVINEKIHTVAGRVSFPMSEEELKRPRGVVVRIRMLIVAVGLLLIINCVFLARINDGIQVASRPVEMNRRYVDQSGVSSPTPTPTTKRLAASNQSMREAFALERYGIHKEDGRHLRLLKRVGAVLDRLNITWWLVSGTLLAACRGGVIPSYEYDVDISILEVDTDLMRRGDWGMDGMVLLSTPYMGAVSDNIFDHAQLKFMRGVTTKVDVVKWTIRNQVLVMEGMEPARRDHMPVATNDTFPLRNCWVGDLLARCPANTERLLRNMYGTLAPHPVVKQKDGSFVSKHHDDVVCFEADNITFLPFYLSCSSNRSHLCRGTSTR